MTSEFLKKEQELQDEAKIIEDLGKELLRNPSLSDIYMMANSLILKGRIGDILDLIDELEERDYQHKIIITFLYELIIRALGDPLTHAETLRALIEKRMISTKEAVQNFDTYPISSVYIFSDIPEEEDLSNLTETHESNISGLRHNGGIFLLLIKGSTHSALLTLYNTIFVEHNHPGGEVSLPSYFADWELGKTEWQTDEGPLYVRSFLRTGGFRLEYDPIASDYSGYFIIIVWRKDGKVELIERVSSGGEDHLDLYNKWCTFAMTNLLKDESVIKFMVHIPMTKTIIFDRNLTLKRIVLEGETRTGPFREHLGRFSEIRHLDELCHMLANYANRDKLVVIPMPGGSGLIVIGERGFYSHFVEPSLTEISRLNQLGIKYLVFDIANLKWAERKEAIAGFFRNIEKCKAVEVSPGATIIANLTEPSDESGRGKGPPLAKYISSARSGQGTIDSSL